MSPELPTVTGRQVIGAFEKAGFEVVRKKGSHRVMKKEGHRHVLSIPVHGSQPLKRGVLRALIKTAGLTVQEFKDLL